MSMPLDPLALFFKEEILQQSAIPHTWEHHRTLHMHWMVCLETSTWWSGTSGKWLVSISFVCYYMLRYSAFWNHTLVWKGIAKLHFIDQMGTYTLGNLQYFVLTQSPPPQKYTDSWNCLNVGAYQEHIVVWTQHILSVISTFQSFFIVHEGLYHTACLLQ